MLLIKLTADEKGKIFVERSDNGGGNVEFFGGSFWCREFPSDVQTGIYEEIEFNASLFKGAVQPRGIVRAVPEKSPKQ